MRTTLGFLVAPPVGVLLPVLIATIGTSMSFNSHELFILLIPISIAYASALLFGVPLFALLKRPGWLRLWQVVAASVLCGIPYGVFHFLSTNMAYAPLDLSVRWLVTVLVMSVIAGLAFWLIAIRNYEEP